MSVTEYVDQFKAFAANGGGVGPKWLAPLRKQAIDRFSALGFPTTHNEDWHFTSVAPIAEATFQPLTTPSGNLGADALEPFLFGHAEWPRVVFVNGRYNEALSDMGALSPEVRVLDLQRAWREIPDVVERHLGKVAAGEDASFTALNTAFMYDGVVVQVAKNSEGTTPLHLVFVSDAHAAKGVAHPRNLLVLDANAKATVIESYVATGEAGYFTNAVTEVVLGEGATLRHVKVQRESERAYHVGTIAAHQARDSHFISFSFATGAALSRTNVYTVLDGEGAGATLDGLYLVDGEQHVDHQTYIEHAQPNCFSRELYKGVLDGASHGVFNGKVLVKPIAQKTDGKQSNNNLLLSDTARVDTKPQLEIFADDVKCTHGATVGRLDEDALFYMKSRGIANAAARQLLTYAFAADVLEHIEEPAVREALEALVLRRFTEQD